MGFSAFWTAFFGFWARLRTNTKVGEDNASNFATLAGSEQSIRRYDYVIVGGGTSGAVLASRISEDPGVTVLLLEAGKSDGLFIGDRAPLASLMLLFNKKYDWSHVITPSTCTPNRPLRISAGRMLGGSSSINSMVWNHPADSDFDEWAALVQDDGWKASSLEPYFSKAEGYRGINSANTHGREGPMNMGEQQQTCEISTAFLDACVGLGLRSTNDLSDPKTRCLGVGRPMTAIDEHSMRVSTRIGYLTKEVLKRPNLTVGIEARVTKILFDTKHPRPRTIGCEFVNSKGGGRFHVHAEKEVILSLGAISTPHLLLLSGIGPAPELKKHDISVVADVPGVGKNLQDHYMCAIPMECTKGTLHRILFSKWKAFFALLKWFLIGKGPFVSNSAETLAFLNSANEKFASEASGSSAPDVELMICPIGFYPISADGTKHFAPFDRHHATFMPRLIRPTSTGEVTLKSSNPFDSPVVDARLYSTDADRKVAVWMIHKALEIIGSPPLSAYVVKILSPVSDFTDHELELFLAENVETNQHPVGTCKMGSKDDIMAVLDPHLQVRAVDRLRVVDASVMPRIVAAHPMGTVVAIAEKMADHIKTQDKTKN